MPGRHWALAAALSLLQTCLGLTAGRSGLTVDLGYAVYEGYHDDTYDLNVWKGYVLTLTSSSKFVCLINMPQTVYAMRLPLLAI